MIVSVELVASDLDLTELARVIGVEPDPGSHSKGDSRGQGTAFKNTCLKLFSGSPEEAPIDEHVKTVLTRLEDQHWESIPASVTGYLVVAIYAGGPMSSVQLGSWICKEVARLGLNIEVVFYVMDEE